MIKSLLFLCLLTCLALPAKAQLGVAFLGQLNYTAELNDIWGYVDGNGREYALVGLTNGVSIVDLFDPANPTQIHFIPGVNSIWRDLKTFGTFAYVSNETANGTLIIDLSGLPGSIVFKDTVLAGVNTAHNVWIADDQLYLIGTNNFNGGIARFSLGPDPWRPQFAGAYTERYVHDVFVRNDTAFSAEISAGFLTIIDWTNPSNPLVLSSTDYLNSFTHNTWLNDAGDACFTTDEIPEGFVYSWDVSDPVNPVQLDGIRSSLSQGRAIPHNVHVFNDYLVTSYYRDGVQIVDASRPWNLVEVAHFDTNPLEDDGFNGAWGAYPFLPSGRILISDIEEGLFVLQPTYQRAAFLEGTIRDGVTQAPVANVSVKLLGTDQSDLSRTTGFYAVGNALGGTFQVAVAKYGYLPDTVTVTLTPGNLFELDLDLTPIGRVPLSIFVRDAVTLAPIPGATVQLTAPNNEATFTYQTISNGLALDQYFVVNAYEVLVGKWGFETQGGTVLVDSVNYTLTYDLQPGYMDDFVLDLGWEVSGTAERGIWERGEPNGTYRENGDIYAPEFDLPFDLGDACYVTGNIGGAPFGDDVDNGYTLLASPWMDLSGYQEPVINYFYWFLNWSLRDGGRPANDFLAVSITDGVDTVEIKRYIGPFDTLWRHETQFHFMKHFQDLQRDFRVLFYTQDFESGNQDAVEAAIDGFSVVETNPTSLDPGENKGRWWVNAEQGTLHLGWERIPPEAAFLIYNAMGQLIGNIAIDQSTGSARWQGVLPGQLYLIRLEDKAHSGPWKKVLGQ